jgi:thiol-disulfide isomerase/thioredoxin
MLPQPGLEPGDEAPEFEAVTHDGRTVRRRSPGGGATVLGFFSSSCHACPEHAPQFRALAKRAPAGAQVVAVVDGSPAEAEHLLELLDGVLTVVGPWSPEGITARYRVSAFRTLATPRRDCSCSVGLSRAAAASLRVVDGRGAAGAAGACGVRVVDG